VVRPAYFQTYAQRQEKDCRGTMEDGLAGLCLGGSFPARGGAISMKATQPPRRWCAAALRLFELSRSARERASVLVFDLMGPEWRALRSPMALPRAHSAGMVVGTFQAPGSYSRANARLRSLIARWSKHQSQVVADEDTHQPARPAADRASPIIPQIVGGTRLGYGRIVRLGLAEKFRAADPRHARRSLRRIETFRQGDCFLISVPLWRRLASHRSCRFCASPEQRRRRVAEKPKTQD